MNKIFIFLIVLFSQTLPLPAEEINVVTLPKGGTNLLHKAVELISGDNLILGSTITTKNNNTILLHHLWKGIVPLFKNKKSKNILLVRDIRDAIVSQKYWINKVENWGGKGAIMSDEEVSRFSALSSDEQISYLIQQDSSREFMQHFSKSIIQIAKDTQAYIIKYEDLVGAKGGGDDIKQKETIKHLASLLGYDISDEKAALVGE
ncbi:MAG: sulfotransferase domain-containing protein [Chlamydiae bacterium]|nr:sulfotransferase domain-containing protein [Chlamydiota bacterium]